MYFIGNIIFSSYIYREYRKYIKYKPIFDDKTNQTINLHDLYPEFRRYDNLSYFRILFGLIFFFWFKIIFVNIILLITIIWLK